MADVGESFHDEIQVEISQVGELPGSRFDASFPHSVDLVQMPRYVSDIQRYHGVKNFCT